MTAAPPAAHDAPTASDRLDDRAKIICLLAFILAGVLIPVGAWWRFGALWAILLLYIVGARIPPGLVALRVSATLPVLVPLAVSLLLSLERGAAPGRYGWERAVSILCGAGLSVSAVTAVVSQMGPGRLLQALSLLRLPRVFVSLLVITHRYIHVLGDEAQRMVRARDSRGRQRQLRARARTAGAMVGSLLVRSYDRADRVAAAMAARGFAGEMPMLVRRRFSASNAVACLAFCGLCAAIVWWRP